MWEENESNHDIIALHMMSAHLLHQSAASEFRQDATVQIRHVNITKPCGNHMYLFSANIGKKMYFLLRGDVQDIITNINEATY